MMACGKILGHNWYCDDVTPCEQCERIAELEAELEALEKAARAVVEAEGTCYPIPASRSYKIAALAKLLEKHDERTG